MGDFELLKVLGTGGEGLHGSDISYNQHFVPVDVSASIITVSYHIRSCFVNIL